MKKSRKQRKQAKARKSCLSQIKRSVAIVTATIVAATAPIMEAVAVEPIVEMVQVEEQAPLTEPVPMSVPISTPTIPPPPDSHVRLVAPQPQEEEALVDHSAQIEEIDRERLFDLRIRSLLGLCLRAEDVLKMVYYAMLSDFLKHCAWGPLPLSKVGTINGVALWTRSGSPTAEGEEVWRRFRLRIRREGALRRIVDGTIKSQVDIATLRPIGPRRVAA